MTRSNPHGSNAELAELHGRALTELHRRLKGGRKMGLGAVLYPLRLIADDLTSLSGAIRGALRQTDHLLAEDAANRQRFAELRMLATRGTTAATPFPEVAVARGGTSYSSAAHGTDGAIGYRMVPEAQAEPLEQIVRRLYIDAQNAKAAMEMAAAANEVAQLRLRDSELASSHVACIQAELDLEVKAGRMTRRQAKRIMTRSYDRAVHEQELRDNAGEPHLGNF